MTDTVSASVKFARDLREIQELSAALTTQAINKAADKLMPGGLAMVSIAPVAAPGLYEQQINDATTRAIELALEFNLDPDDLLPEIDQDTWQTPLQLLRRWTDPLRVDTGKDHPEHPPTDRRPTPADAWMPRTVDTEARFLTWCLTDTNLASHPDFLAITRDTNLARRTLEAILYAGNRAERTRVICDRDFCPKHPPLIRIHAPREIIAWRCHDCGHVVPTNNDLPACPDCGSTKPPTWIWHSDPDDDRYKCTSCKTWYDEAAYLRAHAKQLRSEGAQKYVPLGDAIATLKAQGRSPQTVRNWLRPAEHEADRCTVCNRRQGPSEYPACPEYVIDPNTKQIQLDENGDETTCGGDLVPVWSADLDDIVQGWCDLATKERMVWWPDLWRRHLTTPTRKRRAA